MLTYKYSMNYNFVDIGTSDFQTSVEKLFEYPNAVILLVEPLKFYLDKLPSAENIIKANLAVSDKNGVADIFFLSEEDIDHYNFIQCVRGCNKIGIPHVSIEYELDRRGLPKSLIKQASTQTVTFQELCYRYNIESIDYLKVDTEGHEEFIIPGVLSQIKSGLVIKEIQFENQEHLGNKKLLDSLALEFVELGYTLTHKDADIVLTR
jgi:FkbM family methyltransferase